MALKRISTLTRTQQQRLARVEQALLDQDLWLSAYGINSMDWLVGEITCTEGFETRDLYAVTSYVFDPARRSTRNVERIAAEYAVERDVRYGL